MLSPMRLGAPALVLLAVELALQQEGVEGKAVARRGDVRADDVGAGRRAGAGKQRQQARMIGREHRQLGDRGEGVGRKVGREGAAACSAPGPTSCMCSTCFRVSVRSQ